MISFRVDGQFGGFRGLRDNTGFHTNTANYTCVPDPTGHMVCTGADLTDLQFHNLQDLINQTSAAIYKLFKENAHTAINLGSVRVNGVIDQSTADVLNLIALQMLIPSLEPGMTPERIAHDAPSLISTLSAYVTSVYAPTPPNTNTGGTTQCRNCDPVTGDPLPPPSAGPTVYYVCPDGTQETDPSLCNTTPAPTSSDVAPTIITVPSSDGSATPTVVTVTTLAPSATPDATRVFGLPRNWVLGGAVAAGIGISAGVVALLARRRR